MPRRWIQAAVTGRRTRTVSPTLKIDASLTLNDVEPEGTYASVIEARFPSVCQEPEPAILRNKKGSPVMLMTVSASPWPLPPEPRSTTPLAAIVIVRLTL